MVPPVFLPPFALAALLISVPPAEGPPDDAGDDPVAAARAELAEMDAELDAELGPADADGGPARMPTNEAIALFERRVGGDPADARNRIVLGRLLLRKSKETGDHAAAARAADVLREAADADPDHAPARTYLAVALLARHGFAEALELAEAAAAADPRDTLALATAGDALLELGRTDEAAAKFDLLERKAGRSPAVLARLARVAEARGDRAGAAALIDEALKDAAPGDRSWYLWRRGGLAFANGDLAMAERFYKAARAADPGDAAARAGLAEVAAAGGDLPKAIRLYQSLVGDFGEPPHHAALGDALAAAGRFGEARAQWDLAEAGMAAEAKSAPVPHLREYARFLAGRGRHADLAVDLAVQDLEQVRQDAAAYDALAYALFRAGKLRRADGAAQKALELGPRTAEALYHAALVAAELGDRARARDLLAEALAQNPHFHPLKAPHARRLADALAGAGQ